MSSDTEKVRTQSELAQIPKVSQQTTRNWHPYPDWPGRDDDGFFDVPKILAFCERNNLGSFHPRNRTAESNGQSGKSTYVEARTRSMHEKSQREGMAKEREQIEPETIRGNMLDAEALQNVISN